MTLINSSIQSVTAFAPATCANVAVGFDILGFAFDQLGDSVTLTRRQDNNIVIEIINAKECLPFIPEQNTASVVIQQLCHDLKLEIGFSIRIDKGIPLSSGMGGSAASSVAALVACNAFLNSPLSTLQLVKYALFGEEVASGHKHADNVIPSLFGGLTLIRSMDPIDIIELPIPDIHCALIHPRLQVETKAARKILQKKLDLKDYIKQSANLASFIAALYLESIPLLQHALSDELIEHQRAKFVPGFYKIKEAALKAGALGLSFSGSGPSIFAFAQHKYEASAINQAMQSLLNTEGIDSECWISRINKKQAHVTQVVRRIG
ncbi:MAG: homoserine kinase [Gammaproteobacteria bacterium]|nr:homoserine kinase [Gammaproteobacteria bacterium]